jgi:NADH-quinone oxidoreductase subunit C
MSEEPKGPDRPAAPVPRARTGEGQSEEELRREVPSKAVERLRSRFADALREVGYYAGNPIAVVARERLLEVMTFLRADPELDMAFLADLCGADYPDRAQRFEVVYQPRSLSKGHALTIKIQLGEGEEAPSVTGVWPSANWFEREAYDLLGIRFAGHPDLKRILLTDAWVGHPLRKEYPTEGKPEDHMLLRDPGFRPPDITTGTLPFEP